MNKNNINPMINKKRKGVSVIILLFSILAILSLAGFVIDMGIIFNVRYELQKAAETAALTTIANYNAYETGSNQITYPTVAQITTLATNNLDAFRKSNSFLQMTTDWTPTITFGDTIQSRYSRAIKIEVTAVTKTYFLNLLGIKTIKLDSTAAAMNVPVYLKAGTVLNGAGAYKDTDIRQPAGGAAATVANVGTLPAITNVNTDFAGIYGIQDGNVLSLGPGGYITIKPSLPIIDGKGFDLQIITEGNANGYFVFAGNDTDPSNPYIDAANPGAGIDWVNISCTGIPIGSPTTGNISSYKENIPGIGNQTAFFGSGYFDLGGTTCTDGYSGNVHTAKYLKIIDDNQEVGFTTKDQKTDTDLTATAGFFPGQDSSYTPGVSIDSIAIEHHPRLIKVSDFTVDTDSDGLINDFEQSLGLNPNGSSNGSASSTDASSLWGYGTDTGSAIIIQDNPTTSLRIGLPTKTDSSPKMYINY